MSRVADVATEAAPRSPRVDGTRLLRRIDELATIGAIPGTPGCARLALTDEDRRARDLVIRWMRDLDLDIRIDAIGNIVATTQHPAGAAPVMTGSHIDTVGTGGRYDGNLGVLAGLEVIETAQAAGIDLPRPLAVGVFTDEEGVRFAPDMLGSLVYVGGMPLDEALAIEDRDGLTVGRELDRIGYRGPVPVPGPVPHAFVELHIEQGPVLEDAGLVIGAVESVQGISWTEVTLRGRSCHAGTTPIHLRRDPLLVAARVTTAARELAERVGGGLVATVGSLRVHPDLVNVVPSTTTMTLDVRHTDDDVLREAEHEIERIVQHAAAAEDVTVEMRSMARFSPVVFDPRVVQVVEDAATDRMLPTCRVSSGAGHDAQMFARICPAGMIFVPSVDGISHNVHEYTEPSDVEAGANVLLDLMLRLAATEFDP